MRQLDLDLGHDRAVAGWSLKAQRYDSVLACRNASGVDRSDRYGRGRHCRSPIRFTIRAHVVLDKRTDQVRRNSIITCRVS